MLKDSLIFSTDRPLLISIPPHWRYRPNTWDGAITGSVIAINEYGLTNSQYGLENMFKPDDIVIDIGAHIGSFSYIAYLSGSRNIFAYEPNLDNFNLLVENTSRYGVCCKNKAVWRSDKRESVLFLDQEKVKRTDIPLNTGNYSVFGSKGEKVKTISIDKVIKEATNNFQHTIRMLKLDCEGSEYPILFTISRLDLIQEIVGEYHIADFSGELFDGLLPCNPESLLNFLKGHGFDTMLMQHSENNGLFRSIRDKNQS